MARAALLACIMLTACSAQRGPESRPAKLRPDTTSSAPALGATTPSQATPDVDDRDLARFTRDIDGTGQLVATLVTSKGTLRCALFEADAPRTVANFVGLARGKKPWFDPRRGSAQLGAKLYDGSPFHRVRAGFGIQAGDPSGRGDGGPGFTLRDEDHARHHHLAGSLALVNVAGPHTGGSQIFIAARDLPQLDGQHTVFGRCDDLKVIAAIAATPSDAQGRPTTTVTLERVTFTRDKAP